VVPQCPIAGEPLEGDVSCTVPVPVYGSHNTVTTVRLFIVCVVIKESGTPENIYAWRATVTVSLTFGNSNYGTDRNTPVGAAFRKLHA